MNTIVELLRRVVRAELAVRRGSRLGVVTATFPHQEDGDEHNHEVDVRLKHERLELPRVPISVTHVGLVAPPRVDDLVLVDFLDGDVNQPLVTGRFYHAEERPPLHAEGEVLLEHRVPDGTRNQLRFAADGSILLQQHVTSPAAEAADSEARTSVRIDPDGAVRIDAEGRRVTVDCGQLTVNGDLQVVASDRTTTTISGNEITGGTT